MADGSPPALRALAKHLRCPLTGSELGVERATADGAHGPFAIFTGEGGSYPVILGIPRLLADPARPLLTSLVREGRFAAAAALALSWPSKSLANRIERRVIGRLLSSRTPAAAAALVAPFTVGRRVLRPHGSFLALLDAVTSGYVRDWLAYRFSAATYLPLLALRHAIGPDDRILEIGSGVGHTTHAIAGIVDASRITCMDNVFAHLHAARRFVAPGAAHVCADASLPLPFAAAAFDGVSLSDTYHFVPDQPALAGEVRRVAGPGGYAILSQLHNAAVPSAFAGHARRPADYAADFTGWRVSAYANRDLIDALAGRGAAALSSPRTPADLARTEALSMICLGRERPLGDVADAMRRRSADRGSLMLNPALRRAEDGAVAARPDISPVVRELVCSEIRIGDPREAGRTIDTALAGDAEAGNLARRRLLLIDAPPLYASAPAGGFNAGRHPTLHGIQTDDRRLSAPV